MNTATRKWIGITLGLLLFAALCAGSLWFLTSHVFVEGKAYPRNARQLDLRGTGISVWHWDALHAQLPDCEILWDVPFQGNYYAHDTKELTVTTLTVEDIAELDRFTQLERINADHCTDYPMLAALQSRHPDVEVSYTVTINGRMYPHTTETLILTDISDADLTILQWLPNVKTVDATAITNMSRLKALLNALPHCDISYQIAIAGETFLNTAQALTLTGADPAEVGELLPYLPQVTSVNLLNPVPNAELLLALPEQFPEITFSWQSEIYGIPVTQDTVELNLSSVTTQSLEEVEEILECYPMLEQVVLNCPQIGNEYVDKYRDRVADQYKVVWYVYLGGVFKRTDIQYFVPTKENLIWLNDDHVVNLRYCREMVCVDLGHHAITHCDWAAYMPHLKYLVLADAPVADISGLKDRKELVFLELFITQVHDVSVLETCTALEDLNLSYAWGIDPTPVSRMTWLKRLWWSSAPWSEGTFRQYLPNTELNFHEGSSTGGTWRQGKNYYDMRDLIGMKYMTG